MFGSGYFLAFALLIPGQAEAGTATVSDEPGVTEISDSQDEGAMPAQYLKEASEQEAESDDSPSVLLTMLEEKEPAKKQNRRENPFKEEKTPGESSKISPRKLPPPQPPAQTAESNEKSSNDSPNDSDCGYAECSSDSSSPSECRPTAANRVGLTVNHWLSDISYEGWIDQGVTINPYSPRDRSNYPVAFNNRSNDYQLNQAYLRLKREVDTQGCRWDVGGTVDMLYGTDSAFVSSRGLEVDRNFDSKWNAQQYGLALPQCYMEVFAPWGDGFSMKLGHFYTNLGYETTAAPENFFYSHSYCILYGEPVTETGLMGEKKLGNFKIQAGLSRGWDNWEDNNNDLSFLGGVSWTNDSDRTSLAFAIQSGPEQNEPPSNGNNRNILSLVFQQKLGERFKYVIQYDYGQEQRREILNQSAAQWTGLNQYLFYTITDSWKAGLRFEWFRDADGVRLIRDLQGADYYELTAGLNWTPNSRVIVRPELRYDWVGSPNVTPFIDGSKSYQLLLDCDVIVKF
jgi:hypothetical protein